MNNYLKSMFIAIFLLITISIKGAENVPVIVTSEWLRDNLGKPGLVILHVSSIIRDFENGHIPGAGFLWPGWLSLSNEKESIVPADIKQVRKVLENLGVTNESHLVLCGIYGNLTAVCRVFVMLEHFGLKGNVSILQGGYEDWINLGGQVSVESVPKKKSHIKILISDNLVTAEWLASKLNSNKYHIVDARPKVVYDGSTGTPRQGHIPGAKSLPSTDLYNGKNFYFHNSEKLREIFSSLDIPEGAELVIYCYIGNLGSIDYVAARLVGLNPYLYDGSMEEWGSRFELPVEKH